MKNKRTVEKIHHFNCDKCKKWWSVADAPVKKKKWFCTWCGILNEYKK